MIQSATLKKKNRIIKSKQRKKDKKNNACQELVFISFAAG